jgi:protein-S-isoprenylcysteine O-methyltransferase Ste14
VTAGLVCALDRLRHPTGANDTIQHDTIQRIAKDSQTMIVVGIILLLVGYFAPLGMPLGQIVIAIGWILVVVGAIMLILGATGRQVGGRRYWY